jgi:hypothetical protein
MLVWRVVLRALSATFQRRIVMFANFATGLALALAIGLYARAIGPAVQAASRENPAFVFASRLPQPESAITRILKSEIKLSPDQPFRGRVADWAHLPREARMAALQHRALFRAIRHRQPA